MSVKFVKNDNSLELRAYNILTYLAAALKERAEKDKMPLNFHEKALLEATTDLTAALKLAILESGGGND